MPKLQSLLLAVLVLPAAACTDVEVDANTGELSQPLAGRCTLLEGGTFVTIAAQDDCGPAPAGSQPTCNWSLRFSALDEQSSSFGWLASDVGATGRVVCSEGVMFELRDDGTAGATGSYDPNTNEIEWDGLVYARR